jgi:polysaccharide pyruvyl transferase WcaK-like protein
VTKISIIAATIYGNRGAEAMLTTIIGRVHERNPRALINIFSYYPAHDKKITKAQHINIFSSTPLYLATVLFPFSLLLAVLKRFRLGFLRRFFPKSVVALEQSDVLIDVAGVSFIDGREKFLPFNILTIFPAMLLCVPVVKFSQAIGPFQHFFTNFSARLFLPRCKKIFARGDLSYKHLQELSLPEGIVDNAADVVFWHQAGDAISNENEDYVANLEKTIEEVKRDSKPLIGICPSSVIASNAKKEGWNYTELLYRIAKELLANGHPVLLFPNATRKESKGKLRNNDLPVIEETVMYFAAFDEWSKNLYYVTEDINTESIKRLLEHCDFVIVSRFHAMITSLSMGKPTLVLGWGHKYFEVMDRFGLKDYVLDYKHNEVSTILNNVKSLMDNASSVRENIKTALPLIRSLSQRQFDYLFELLKI